MYSVVKYKKPETLYVTGSKSLIQNDFDTAIPAHGQVSILYFGFLRPTRVMGKKRLFVQRTAQRHKRPLHPFAFNCYLVCSYPQIAR